jgi:hypothetical protein
LSDIDAVAPVEAQSVAQPQNAALCTHRGQAVCDVFCNEESRLAEYLAVVIKGPTDSAHTSVIRRNGMNMTEGPGRYGVMIGGMKCGTTSLFDYLARHPDVCASAIKETNFFSGDKFEESDLTGYHKLWPDWCPEKHKIAIEASPNYTKIPSRPNVPQRIAQFQADRRFSIEEPA